VKGLIRRTPVPTVLRTGREVVAPVARAGAFYAACWHRWVTSRGAPVEPPLPRPTVSVAGHALIDEVVITGFRLVRARSASTDRARFEREARAALDHYGAAGWLDRPQAFFATPPALGDVTVRPARAGRLAYEHWSFDSGYEPGAGEPGGERWSGYRANRRSSAWVLRHDEPRPWLVCVHAAEMGGRPAVDLSLLRARWLHEDLGLNVALPVLPLHGERRAGTGATFPSEDMLDNVHGFAQAVWDVRRLIGRLREDGQPIGLTGISLGGCVASLLAGIEAGLACVILGVPLVDLVDIVEGQAPWRRDTDWQRVMGLARQVMHVVSPLSHPPLVPRDRRFIYTGTADRLVDPRLQVQRIWEFWERPHAHWYHGGHVGCFRSPPVGRYVEDALARSGLLSPQPALR